MKLSNEVLKAKKDKNLRSIVIQDRNDKQVLRLCIEQRNKYNNESNMIYVECETDIKYSAYNRDISECSFILEMFNNHIRTFLRKIGKNSNVSFVARIGNLNQYIEEKQLQRYELFGKIGKDTYLLSETVMPQNTASPIK